MLANEKTVNPQKIKCKDVCSTPLGNTPKHRDKYAEKDLELAISLVKNGERFASSPVNKGQQYRQDQELTVSFAKHHSWECILERAGLKEEFSFFRAYGDG